MKRVTQIASGLGVLCCSASLVPAAALAHPQPENYFVPLVRGNVLLGGVVASPDTRTLLVEDTHRDWWSIVAKLTWTEIVNGEKITKRKMCWDSNGATNGTKNGPVGCVLNTPPNTDVAISAAQGLQRTCNPRGSVDTCTLRYATRPVTMRANVKDPRPRH